MKKMTVILSLFLALSATSFVVAESGHKADDKTHSHDKEGHDDTDKEAAK